MNHIRCRIMNRSSAGFTLLEVMVALAIMAVLSLLTTQTIRSGITNRILVTTELSRDSKLADTLRIIRSDIAQAFHYQDFYCKMGNDLLATPTPPPGAPGQPPVPPPMLGAQQAAGPTPKPCPPNYTGFIGTAEKVYFTTLSNTRTIRDSQESDQAKIGYYTKSCRTNASGTSKGGSSRCLYRSHSPLLDEELERPGTETMLMEDIEEFKLRYLGPEHQDYVDTWRTGKNGDDVTRDKFPYAVEITLTIHNKNDPKDKPATQTILAPIAFENNPKKKADPSPSPGAKR